MHIYLGCAQFPESLAPGQFPYQASADSSLSATVLIPAQDLEVFDCSQLYFIAHTEVDQCNIGVVLNESRYSIPTSDSILTVYPNPFKDSFIVRYKFDYETYVKFEVLDIQGRLVTSTVNSNYNSGALAETKIEVNSNSIPVLFLRVTTHQGTVIKKLISK